jgi:hypothetical protein
MSGEHEVKSDLQNATVPIGNVRPNAAIFTDLKGDKHYFPVNYDVPEYITTAFRNAVKNGTSYENLDPTMRAMEVKREDIKEAIPV